VSTLETVILIAAMKIVNAERIFEIGTFTGSTTLNLALNLNGGKIFTLDLDEASAQNLAQDVSDPLLLRFH
jgi:predicted O-methyltransferase YrrM